MKLRNILSTLLTTLVLSANSVLATAWVAEPALTSLQFGTQQAYWKAAPYGLRPTCINGYETPAGVRFAAVWEKHTGPAWYSAYGRTANQLEAAFATYAASNIQLVYLSGYTVGAMRFYNAIWEQRGAGNAVYVAGVSKQSLDTVQSVRLAQGYTLTYVSNFTVGGVALYNAIWTKGGTMGPPDEFAARYHLTTDRFESDLAQYSAAGYRLTAHTTSYEAGVARIAAVFRRPFGVGWWNAARITEANFTSETLNAYYQGYRPTYVSAYRENGNLCFNAVWTYNGGLEPQIVTPAEDVIHSYMEAKNLAGLSLAVSLHGRLIYAKAFGMANKVGVEWMNPHHRLRIGSVSKLITAAGVLRQKETGILTSLDRKVFGPGSLFNLRYGKKRPYNIYDTDITIRHLLSHTSGWFGDVPFNPDRDAYIDSLLDDLLNSPPGTAAVYKYRNDNFLVLGRVIEQVSGKTYQKYVKDSVLAPCGITGMEIGGNTLAQRKPGEVVYYSTTGNTYYRDLQHGDSAGGWIARPLDLLLLLRRIDGSPAQSDLISQGLHDQMVTDFVGMGYGLGTILRPNFRWPAGSHWGHDGALEGTYTYLRHYNSGLALALICNQDASGFYDMVDDVGAALNVAMAPDHDYFPVVNAAYDSWTTAHFHAGVRARPGLKADIWGPEADPDGDGITNALEAGLGSDPLTSNAAPQGSVMGNDYVMRWQQRLPLLSRGVQLVTEVTYSPIPELQIWEPGPPIQVASILTKAGFVTFEARLPLGNGPQPILRLRAKTP